METPHFNELVSQQRKFFATGATHPLAFRLEQLKKLKMVIQNNEAAIGQALMKDLHKAPMEVFMSEVYLVIDEIELMLKKLKNWLKPLKVATPFPLAWPGRSAVYFEPYGCVLIIAAWNYPFSLLMSPLIGAMSAGNCVVIKPSEISTHLQEVMVKLINDNFSSSYITAIKAGPEETQQLLTTKFDYIFFTGSTSMAK